MRPLTYLIEELKMRTGLLVVALGFLSLPSVNADDPKPSTYCVLPIRGTIGIHVTDESIEKALRLADQSGASHVMLEIDSPGGYTSELDKISQRLVDWQSKGNRELIAYVNPHAYSAAAIVAVACKKIYVSPGATIGATAEIAVSTTTNRSVAIVQEKRNSVTRAKDRALAQFSGHEPLLVLGMFDPDIVLAATQADGKFKIIDATSIGSALVRPIRPQASEANRDTK